MLDDYEAGFQKQMTVIRRFKEVGRDSKLLEIGTGMGSFPLLCQREGISCKGLEISPQLVAFAHELGRKNGLEPDIELGNVEEIDLGDEEYDVIIALSVFEHVERWRRGLGTVYRAL
jgi:2-polyprenyl-3-methyl-5-hydroxy-6-metoxy-1,4-benzoquinol methylase